VELTVQLLSTAGAHGEWNEIVAARAKLRPRRNAAWCQSHSASNSDASMSMVPTRVSGDRAETSTPGMDGLIIIGAQLEPAL